MNAKVGNGDPENPPDGPRWSDLAFEIVDGRPTGYVMGRVLVPRPTDQALDSFMEDVRELGLETVGELDTSSSFVVLKAQNEGDADAEWTRDAVGRLRDKGYRAQVDHVLFADQADGDLFTANPFTANPFTANPFTANPFTANRFDANRWPRTTQAQAAGVARNTARPSPRGWRPASETPPPDSPPEPDGTGITARILVLDTGLPDDNLVAGESQPLIAGLRNASSEVGGTIEGLDGTARAIADDYWSKDDVDVIKDGHLDPVAGHGVFIASIIKRIAPSAQTVVVRVLRKLGVAMESEVAHVLEWAAGREFDIVSLSFSAYRVPQDSYDRISEAVHRVRQAGAVVVASAGNEAVWEAPIPAALHGVIAVAALDELEAGPAWFTNYGPWVDACAPGSAVEGDFWKWSGEREWRGRALWSGTSFAAPYVAAAIARIMRHDQLPVHQAAGQLFDDNSRGSIPWHGRIVRGF